MKAHPVAQMKDVGQWIGDFPTLGKPWLQIEVFVAADQRVEKQFVNSLRLRIHSHAGIEVGGAALDDHYQRVGIGLARAAGEKDHQKAHEKHR